MQKKYDETIRRYRQERYGLLTSNYDSIINLAGVELSTIQKEVLCRGVDFGFPPRVSQPEILAEFELLQRQTVSFAPVSKEAAERSRCDLAAIAQEVADTKPNLRKFSLHHEHRKALRELRNENLVIVRPDKGRATVILTRDEYVQKMLTILQDQSKFVCLGPCDEFDCTLKTEKKLQSYLKRLRTRKEISLDVYDRITPTGSARPRLYGLPKVHKPGVPLRPILSMVGSPQYGISKWLCELLNPVVQYYGVRCVKDSFTFSDSVKSAQLSSNGFMCSFDVVSLFTNVPLKEVIDICADAIYRNDDIEIDVTTLCEQSFRSLMEFATSGVEFSFDGIMYKQVDGVAMGSPLGPALANIFVGFHEKRIPEDAWPEIYHRYVDDVFSHFVNREESVAFFERLNSLHPALRFTREDEQSGTLPFMDVNVMKTDNSVETAIYRKPTFTGLYVPWDSYSATQYKVNLVRSLAHRARRLCSPRHLEAELQTLRAIFLRNGYPGYILDQHLVTVAPRRQFIGPRLCPLIIRLPWFGDRSDMLVRKIDKAVRTAYFAATVRAVFSTAKAFALPKDRLPIPVLSNVVYKFECRHCESRYVGRTTQHLADRIKQHAPRHLMEGQIGAKRRGRPPKERASSDDYQSAVSCHLAASADCRQAYVDSNFTVLARARDKLHLQILESAFIHVLKPDLCVQKNFVAKLRLFASGESVM